MSENKGWQSEPFSVDIKKGDTKAYCMCGLSKKPPFCDGSHKDTHHVPMVVHYDADQTVYVCGCRQSANLPFCDGTHKTLS